MSSNITASIAHRSQILRGLILSALALPFIAAPTPGNIGGCGGSYAATPVQPATGQTAEAAYFEQGLCAHFCRRLLDCGQICQAMTTTAPGCEMDVNMQNVAYYDCVHSTSPVLRQEIFGATSCPHKCPGELRFAMQNGAPLVYQMDVQVCGDAVLARACGGSTSDPSSIASAISTAPPNECVQPAICR